MNNPHIRPEPPTQFAKIPNNIIGRLFLWALRRWLNKERYSIMTRGRKPKRGYKVARWQHDLPKAHAKQLGVYIVDRWENKARQWKWEEESRELAKERQAQREAMAKKERAKAITTKISNGERYFPPGDLFFRS